MGLGPFRNGPSWEVNRPLGPGHRRTTRGDDMVALLAGGKNPANVELMPAAVRCTGLAVAFNVAEGYFGGTTPLIATWLIAQTENPLSPGVWVAFSGLCTLITVVVFTRETAFRPLSSGNT